MGPMDTLRLLRSNGSEVVGRLKLRSDDDDVTDDDDIMGGDIIGGTGIMVGDDIIGGDDIIERLLLRLLLGWRLLVG